MEIFSDIFNKFTKISRRDKFLLAFVFVFNLILMAFLLLSDVDLETYAALGYLGVGTANFMTSATIFTPVSAAVVTFIAAKSLDPVLLIVISSIGTTIGEGVIYILGDGIDEVVNQYKWHKKLKKWFFKAPFLFLVIWVALPNPVQAFGQIFAGSTRYPIWKYSLAIFIGNAIWFTLVVYAGQWFFDLGLI